MESTRRLDIELPEDVADAVEARVSAGEYASVSEVIEEGLRALAERDDELLRDPAVERWLRETVVPEAQRVREGKARWYSPEEVLRELDARRAKRAARE